ncbi:hypothetical protein ACROYT_G035310 [Oculina patagonica]
MKLVFIIAVFVFFLENPSEAKVPDLPDDLVHLQTYLQNQDDSLKTIQGQLHATNQNLAKLYADVTAQGVMLQQLHQSLTVTHTQLTYTFGLITKCLKYHEE